MRLSDFIRQQTEQLSKAWEAYARTLLPAAATMDDLALRDHCPDLLRAIARDIESSQTPAEAVTKSLGQKKPTDVISQVAADVHAELRHGSGFSITQLAGEYRALRASVTHLWRLAKPVWTDADIGDLERFNEALDEALAASLGRYSDLVDDAREMFLAILGHDLRTPLNAISITADTLRLERMPDVGTAAQRISRSTVVIDTMVVELLDFVRKRLSREASTPMLDLDMREVCKAAIEICQSASPDVRLRFEASGEGCAEGDRGRLEQMLRNLVSNAIQHGKPGSEVSISLSGDDNWLRITVENTGQPIPPEAVQTLFDPLARVAIGQPDASRGTRGLGLGLFIVREIARAHAGAIRLESARGRTQVIVELPRRQLHR